MIAISAHGVIHTISILQQLSVLLACMHNPVSYYATVTTPVVFPTSVQPSPSSPFSGATVANGSASPQAGKTNRHYLINSPRTVPEGRIDATTFKTTDWRNRCSWALGTGLGFILKEPPKEVACTTVCIFNKFDVASSLSKDVEDILQTQKETIASFNVSSRPTTKGFSY